MNKKFSFFLVSILLILSVFGCAPRSSYTLLYDMKPDSLYSAKYTELSKVKVGDRIGIVVRSQNPELAKPFNSIHGNVVVARNDNAAISISEADFGINSDVTKTKRNTSSSENTSGFIVNIDGDIMFPVLGKVHVNGLTLPQISEKIRNLIIKGGYINDPVVETMYTDFRIYIINGSSGNVLNVKDDKINILQVVAQGLNTGANHRLDNVAVIRQDKNGYSKIYFNNLLSSDIFNSPTFYLQPGDILYMQPKYQPIQNADMDNIFRYTSYVFTTIFTIISIVNVINK